MAKKPAATDQVEIRKIKYKGKIRTIKILAGRYEATEMLPGSGLWALYDRETRRFVTESDERSTRYFPTEGAAEAWAFGKKPPKRTVTVTARQVGKTSAAALFRQLILENKLTDDQIFQEVQKSFGLPDSRRSYVDYYRRELGKTGQLK